MLRMGCIQTKRYLILYCQSKFQWKASAKYRSQISGWLIKLVIKPIKTTPSTRQDFFVQARRGHLSQSLNPLKIN
jgi:hypothetical protein